MTVTVTETASIGRLLNADGPGYQIMGFEEFLAANVDTHPWLSTATLETSVPAGTEVILVLGSGLSTDLE